MRIHRVSNYLLFTEARRAYRRALAAERPDVVHLQGGYVPALQRMLALDARAAGVPVVLTPHNAFPRAPGERARRAFRRLLESADRIVLLAESDPDALGAAGGNLPPSSVIPFGPLDFFASAPGGADRLRKKLAIPRDAFVVLSFGYLRRDKGRGVLLDALTRPAASGIWLLVAGDPGGERAALEREIQARSLGNRVRTDLRYIPNDEVGAYFDAADAVVLPYEIASESGAFRAALAHRRPVVAAAVGGLAAAIVEGRTGFLASPGDAGSLAEALERALEAGAEGRRRIANEALHSAEADAGWDIVAFATRALYEDLLAGTAR
jgi:glycosyltransferase involved in cell wall biosynthesis